MKPNTIIIYLIDNTIIFWPAINEEAVFESVPPGIINCGKVAKPKEFGLFLKIIQKKYRLSKPFTNNYIYVLCEPYYTKAEQKILYDCLENTNVNNIKLINITNLLKLDYKTIWIILNKQYLCLVEKEYKNKVTNTLIEYKIFKNNINKLIEHLNFFIKNKQIKVMGTYPNIPDIAKNIEDKLKVKVYYINDFNKYIITNFKNTLLE